MTIYSGPFPFQFSATLDGILVSHTAVNGVIEADGAATISTSGIRVVDSTINGGTIQGHGAAIFIKALNFNITGGISIDAGSVVESSSTGIYLETGHLSGNIYNAGVITGGILWDNLNFLSVFSGSIINTGTITSGTSGNAAVWLFVEGVSLFDSGLISGTNGSAAITFATPGDVNAPNPAVPNTLTLGAGYNINGAVKGGGIDILQLGGSGSATFALGNIGSGQQYTGFTTFNVVGGAWKLTGTGSESWTIKAGTLELASGASIAGLTFFGSGGTLQLDTGRNQVSGSIIGAGIGDAIDLRSQAFTAGMHASWSQTTSTAGTLSLVNGSTLVTTLTLNGDYAPGEFQVGSDNNSGTLIQIVAPPKPTVLVQSLTNQLSHNAIALSSLVTISDPGGVGYQKLELWDSKGTSVGGQFVVNTLAQTGNHEIDVTPANVAHTTFETGTSAGTDTLWAQIVENDGTLTGWQQFTVTVPEPTLTVQNVASATKAQTINLSSLVTIANPGGISYQKLELWDANGTATGGQFFINGQAQTGNHEIDVPTGATVTYVTGTAGGTDQLWAQILQTDGTLTGWQPFTVTVSQPTLTVTSKANATPGQQFDFFTGGLITVSDPNNVGYKQMELWDTDGTSAGGFFSVGHVAGFATSTGPQSGGHEIDTYPPSAALGTDYYQAPTVPGTTDTIWVQLELNDGTLTGWQKATISVPGATVSVTSVSSATASQSIALSSLVAINDPNHVGYTKLELWDSNGTAAGGHFMINSTAQTGGHEIDVLSSQVSSGSFVAGTAEGTDTLWAQLQLTDGSVTGWQQFTVTVPLPTLTVFTDIAPKSFSASNLISISDPGNVGYQKLELWDSNGTAAGGQFFINGQAQTGNHEIDVPTGATVTFKTGTIGGTDKLWAQLLQNNGTLTGWQPFAVFEPQPSLNVQNIASATEGQAISLSSLVSVSDPISVGYTTLELWDSNGTAAGGQFFINGVAQTGGHEIDVAPADLANTVFEPGTSPGTDTLWAQILQNDGTTTGWQQFTVTTPAPTLNVTNYSISTASQQVGLASLMAVSDPGNQSYQMLELWDDNGTATTGQFIVNGVAQTGNHEIDVSATNAALTEFKVGSAGNSDTLYARLLQNDGTLTAWQEFTVTSETVAAGGTQELVFANADPITFAGSTGTLQLDNSASFAGTVAGMTGQDAIDFRDINFASIQTPILQNATSTGGTLHVTDGTHTANIALLGNYLASTFVASSDGHGGTSVIDTPAANQNYPLAQAQHA